ncbi:hypothetical protein [Crocosphaera sp. XPORK-15E]|nr:hypothetical protein [Crocosphaera sp. XPORK-15E]MEA5534082.1 hypothetical protein [Crocosphaera sp. XPORK-15E]
MNISATLNEINALNLEDSAIADLVGWVEERNPTNNPFCDYYMIRR